MLSLELPCMSLRDFWQHALDARAENCSPSGEAGIGPSCWTRRTWPYLMRSRSVCIIELMVEISFPVA